MVDQCWKVRPHSGQVPTVGQPYRWKKGKRALQHCMHSWGGFVLIDMNSYTDFLWTYSHKTLETQSVSSYFGTASSVEYWTQKGNIRYIFQYKKTSQMLLQKYMQTTAKLYIALIKIFNIWCVCVCVCFNLVTFISQESDLFWKFLIMLLARFCYSKLFMYPF